MKKCTILTHQGLGDMIICNGIIRNYSKKYDFVYVISPDNNYNNAKYMYRDLSNVEVIYIDWSEVIVEVNKKFVDIKDLLLKYNIGDTEFIPIVFFNHRNQLNGVCFFDEWFYSQVNLDLSKRWEDFFVKREFEREINLFNKLGLKENNYILINNEASGGISNIPYYKEIKNKNKKIIFTSKLTDNIFDWCYTIENATEIHTICSAFKHLMDSLNLERCDNLVYYIKSNTYTKSKNKWIYKIINGELIEKE